MKIKATTLRGTIFTQRIPLDNNTLQKILPLFDGYAVEMVPAGPEGPFPAMAFNWSLKSSKEDCRIVFGNATIDIIKNVNTESISDAITAFSLFCQTSFENIYANFGNPVSRMALAPSLKVDLENESEFMSNSDFDDFFDEDDIEMSKNKIDKARIVNSIENDDFDENEVENLYHSIR